MAAKSQRSVAPLSNAESDREGASARARQLRCAQTVYTPHSSHRAMLAFVRYRHSFGFGGPSRYSLTDADCKFLVERRNGDSFVQRRVEKLS